MKITLKEAKEKVPAEYLTSFVAKGWEEISGLKAEIAGIKKEFTDTAKVEEALQDLLDAYLVTVGRLQAYLEDKNMVVLSTEPVNEALTEALEEDTNIQVDNVNVAVDNIKHSSGDGHHPAPNPELRQAEQDEVAELERIIAAKMAAAEDDEEKKAAPLVAKSTTLAPASAPQPNNDNSFGYFCDFDEPDLSEPPLTDADLY